MKAQMEALVPVMAVALIGVVFSGCPPCAPTPDTWAWTLNNNILEIAYGNPGGGWPQLAALHMNTGALRLIYGPESGWGPTVYIPPSLWTQSGAGETHHLGAALTGTAAVDNGELTLELAGTIAGVPFVSTVRFSPPTHQRFEARVRVETSGAVPLADRPGEAFKPVHTATMIISDTEWDSHAVQIDGREYPLPLSGWVLEAPGALSDTFTLAGGSSQWKPNAPSITIALDRPMSLQGWVTESLDPNDDNVGFWCASNAVLDAWEYTISATP